MSALHAQLMALEGGVEHAFLESWLGDAAVATATADGRLVDAEAIAWSAADGGGELSPQLWLGAARCSLWAGDPRRAADALHRFDGPMQHALTLSPVRDALTAAVGFALGQKGCDFDAVCEARRSLLHLGLRWPAALVAIDAAIVFGIEEPGVTDELADARAFLADVQSSPYLRIIDHLIRA